MNRPIFWVNNLNKGEWVYRACASALSQTIPCNILFTDAHSSDNSLDEMLRAIEESPRGADHNVVLWRDPLLRVSTFQSFSEHWMHVVLNIAKEKYPESEWILQCSSDDISLPDRAKVCMEAVKHNPCSAIATTMFFADPLQAVDIMSSKPVQVPVSGFPVQTGYVNAGEGLQRLGYGSVIAGYSRKFLEKVGGFNVTPDVFYGFLAALDEGFYVVANPQHIHIQHAKESNLGFGGKLLAASGDELARLNELNQFQLYRTYFATMQRAAEVYGSIKQDDLNGLYSMMLNHGMGWYQARENLHRYHITPGIL